MKVLFLHTDSFGSSGGIGKFNRDFLTAICCIPGAQVTALPRIIEEKRGAPQVSLGAGTEFHFDTSGLGGKLRYCWAALRAVRQDGPFDLVICGHINLLPIARLCIRRGNRLGLIIHGIDAWQPTTSRLVNGAVKNVAFFIAVSDFTRQKFCGWSGLDQEQGFILPNCVELEKFGVGLKSPELLTRYGLEGKKIVLTVGRMSANERYKGFDEILEVLPQLAEKIPEIAYLVVGEGDDRPRLMQKAIELGLDDRVIFTGQITEEEKVDYYRLADVFAMPGWGEGFGIVYLEALACGIPVIASSADASREALLGGELGLVVNPDIPAEIIAGIQCAMKKTKMIPSKLNEFSSTAYRKRVSAIFSKLFSLKRSKS